MTIEHTDESLSNDYSRLLDDVSSMYEPLAYTGKTVRNRLLVKVFWEIGHRIVSVLQRDDGEWSARYGERVVEKLSRDLTERYGEGFGRSNLFYMRQFALEVPKADIADELNWTHYRILFGVTDSDRRAALLQRVVSEQLSCKALRQLLREDAVGDGHDFGLTPRDGRLGLVRLERTPSGKSEWLVNFGFHFRRRMSLQGPRGLTDGEIVAFASDSRVKRVNCRKTERYCYDAEVLKVVDGDTLRLRIQLADGGMMDEIIRLRGVDAPERATAEGRRTAAFVRRRVHVGDRVRVHTYACDLYGRYVGDVFYSANMTWLNEELVQSGKANFLDMKV